MKQHFRLYIVTIFFIAASVYLLKDGAGYGNNQIYSGLLGNILATAFAAFLVWVAWEQWSKLSQTSSADFIHKLTEDFFTPDARTLMSLIECKALVFEESTVLPDDEITSDGLTESQCYFRVDCEILKKAHLPDEIIYNLTKRKFYSAWEIDDFLLSPLEDVGTLEEKRIVDFNMVYSGFSYYLEKIIYYPHIANYINSMRVENTDDNGRTQSFIYGSAQNIAKKCLEYDELHSGLCKWSWLFKRQFCHISPKIEFKIQV